MYRIPVFFLLITLSFLPALAHDLQLGIFDIYRDKNVLRLDIRLDKNDLITAIQNQYPYLDFEDDSLAFKSCIEEYILENLSIKVNGQDTNITFHSQQFQKEVISVFTSISSSIICVDNIYIRNSILIETVQDQANIINAKLHDMERSFRLHKERISTVIEYDD
jgi:hypothetical protein